MQFHTTERLGAVQSLTKEGFLVCQGVPIARTGVLYYAPGELPIPPGDDGIIRVHRDATDVFNPTSIASFEGKSVVDMRHPKGDVTTANWRQLAVGHVQNVRQGTADAANLLLADLVVKEPNAIAAVRKKNRHVSCGYDATYRVFARGNAQQVNIVGNHVALVPTGRAGPTCSIGDSAMSAFANRGLIDRIRAAFQTQDETMLTAALAEAAVGERVEPIFVMPRTNTQDADGAAVARATMEAITKLTGTVDGLATKLNGFETTLTALKTKDEASTVAATAAAKVAQDAAAAEAAAVAARLATVTTGDSAGLAASFQDIVARAEILVPGVPLPTFDAAAPPAATEAVLTGFRRRVLAAAQNVPAAKAQVAAMLPAGVEVTAMTADAVGMVFHGATELAKAANNRGTPRSGHITDSKTRKGPPTPAEINEYNRKHYGLT